MQKKPASRRIPENSRKNELTLDERFLYSHSSRVSSLLSWYLTSLINLSFYSFDLPFYSLLLKSIPQFNSF